METLIDLRGTRSDAGFTLIEVMIGMILLTIGTLALAGGVAIGARRLTGSQDQMQAFKGTYKLKESYILEG